MMSLQIKHNVFIIIISLVFVCLSCKNPASTNITGELVGKWQLINVQGTLHDICPGEIIEFLDLSRVTLQCPHQLPMQNTYTVGNAVLTYVETNTQYYIVVLNNSTLELGGLGAAGGRHLTYEKIH